MKIVHILLGSANPETMNGVNKVVHYLATEQLRTGNDVEVWGLTKNWQRPPEHAHEYPLHFISTTRSRFLPSPVLRSRLQALRPGDWVQLHSVFIPEFLPISRHLHKTGVRFGVTPHGGYSAHVLAKGRAKKALYLHAIESKVLRWSSLVQAIGASEVDDIRRVAPTANVVLVPNGQHPIDAGGASGLSRRAERPIFAYCGRLAAQHKGLDLLIRGFGEYRASGGKGTLWLIGDGPDREALHRLSEQCGVDGEVAFHGARFGDEKRSLLLSSDAFVHTSRWDVVPTAALEAAALGLPLLVSVETNMGAPVRAFDAGSVLAENTPSEIAIGLRQVEGWVADGSARKVGQRARQMIAERFSWSHVSEMLLRDYRAANEREELSP